MPVTTIDFFLVAAELDRDAEGLAGLEEDVGDLLVLMAGARSRRW